MITIKASTRMVNTTPDMNLENIIERLMCLSKRLSLNRNL
jgi:hypothetical protein